MAVSCFCHTSDAKGMWAGLYKAEKRQLCAGCRNRHQDTVMSENSSSRVVAESTDTRTKTGWKQAETVHRGGKSRSTRRRRMQSKIAALLSQHPWHSSRLFWKACAEMIRLWRIAVLDVRVSAFS